MPFKIEFVLCDVDKIRRRFVFSTSFRNILPTDLHVQIPLSYLPTDKWLNVYFNLEELYNTIFGSHFLKCESILVTGLFKIKKIFATRFVPVHNDITDPALPGSYILNDCDWFVFDKQMIDKYLIDKNIKKEKTPLKSKHNFKTPESNRRITSAPVKSSPPINEIVNKLEVTPSVISIKPKPIPKKVPEPIISVNGTKLYNNFVQQEPISNKPYESFIIHKPATNNPIIISSKKNLKSQPSLDIGDNEIIKSRAVPVNTNRTTPPPSVSIEKFTFNNDNTPLIKSRNKSSQSVRTKTEVYKSKDVSPQLQIQSSDIKKPSLMISKLQSPQIRTINVKPLKNISPTQNYESVKKDLSEEFNNSIPNNEDVESSDDTKDSLSPVEENIQIQDGYSVKIIPDFDNNIDYSVRISRDEHRSYHNEIDVSNIDDNTYKPVITDTLSKSIKTPNKALENDYYKNNHFDTNIKTPDSQSIDHCKQIQSENPLNIKSFSIPKISRSRSHSIEELVIQYDEKSNRQSPLIRYKSDSTNENKSTAKSSSIYNKSPSIINISPPKSKQKPKSPSIVDSLILSQKNYIYKNSPISPIESNIMNDNYQINEDESCFKKTEDIDEIFSLAKDLNRSNSDSLKQPYRKPRISKIIDNIMESDSEDEKEVPILMFDNNKRVEYNDSLNNTNSLKLNQEESVELFYDPKTKLYYDPKTNKYYSNL